MLATVEYSNQFLNLSFENVYTNLHSGSSSARRHNRSLLLSVLFSCMSILIWNLLCVIHCQVFTFLEKKSRCFRFNAFYSSHWTLKQTWKIGDKFCLSFARMTPFRYRVMFKRGYLKYLCMIKCFFASVSSEISQQWSVIFF